ncbi:MAG TPA: hypothetical protein VGD43_03880 [Micromonospora sp.]
MDNTGKGPAGSRAARWRIDRTGLLFAIGAPVGGLAIVLGATALNAYRPESTVDNWVVRILLFVIGLAGYGLLLFTQLRYFNVLVFLGAFLAFFLGLNQLRESVEELVLHERGETITCIVLDVDRRESVSTDANGHQSTTTWYDYRLDCPDPQVREMTTGGRLADRGDSIEVLHDPSRRLTPRPAVSVDGTDSSLRSGALLFAAGVVLRLLYELRVPPFGGRFGSAWSGPRRWWRRRRDRRA